MDKTNTQAFPVLPWEFNNLTMRQAVITYLRRVQREVHIERELVPALKFAGVRAKHAGRLSQELLACIWVNSKVSQVFIYDEECGTLKLRDEAAPLPS